MEILHKLNLELKNEGIAVKYDNNTSFDPNRGVRLRKPRFVLKGHSDIVVYDRSGVAFIEVKTDEGGLRDEQRAFLKKMQSLGHRAGVARNYEQAIAIVRSAARKEEHELEPNSHLPI